MEKRNTTQQVHLRQRYRHIKDLKKLHICSQTIPETRFIRPTMFSTILFHLLSVEIKKSDQSGEQTEPQKPSTGLSQVTEGQATYKQPFSIYTLWSCTLQTMCWTFWKMAVFAVQVATTEGPASIFFQTSN